MDGYIPSLEPYVEQVLELAELRAGELLVELGSGDGRYLLAAQRRGARAIGYEIDAELARKCRVERSLDVRNQDCMTADVSGADVVTLWFTDPFQEEVLEKLQREMKTGARIISIGAGDRATRRIDVCPSKQFTAILA